MERQAGCQKFIVSVVISAAVMTSSAGLRADDQGHAVEVRGGTVAFDAATNVGAISIHGKSTALVGRAKVKVSGGVVALEALEATVPVKTLDTGMQLRDNHMRKYVFTTPDGQVPDLRFSANTASCEGDETRSTCKLTGDLTVRGTARPFAMALKITRDGASFRAAGDGVVKLSAYGIPIPSQLGVRTEDDVKLRVEFTARPTAAGPTSGGGQ